MSPELAALVVRFAGGEKMNVRAACADLGCSKTQFYKYVERFKQHGVDGFYPRSRRPVSSPRTTTVEVEDLIVSARKQLAGAGWDAGADSIRFQLIAWRDGVVRVGEDGVERCGLLPVDDAPDRPWPTDAGVGVAMPSRVTINRVLDRRGQLIAMPQRRPRRATRRFEADHPNTRWQMDGFEVALADGTTVCVIHIVDDCSRYDIALTAVRSENSHDVWTVVQDAIARYGLPAQLLTDNGTAFSGARRGWVSALTENLTSLGVDHITSSIGHPQTCGKCERAHRTCRQWLDKRPAPATITDLNGLLLTYRQLHNNNRPRTHLHGLTPAQRYRLGPHDGPTGATGGPDRVEVHHKPVAPNGTIAIDRVSLGIGRAHAGHTVAVIRQNQQLAIIAGDQLIAEATLKRGIRYQSAHRPATQVSAKS